MSVVAERPARRPAGRPGPRTEPPPPRPRRNAVDPARLVAFDLLREVRENDAYANLVLPRLISARRLDGRDAGLATELGYGTIRATGTLDAILARCVDRGLTAVEAGVLDVLRLGAYQLLRTRVPAHAAVATTVDLAHAVGHGRAAGFVNAVLRRVAAHDWDAWTDLLAEGAGAGGRARRCAPRIRSGSSRPSPTRWAATSPRPSRPCSPTTNARSPTWSRGRAAAPATSCSPPAPTPSPGRGRRTPCAWPAVTPGDLDAVRDRHAGVQDEGSQLCAIAAATAPLDGPDARWLDACAGPGGKAALLAALAGRARRAS